MPEILDQSVAELGVQPCAGVGDALARPCQLWTRPRLPLGPWGLRDCSDEPISPSAGPGRRLRSNIPGIFLGRQRRSSPKSLLARRAGSGAQGARCAWQGGCSERPRGASPAWWQLLPAASAPRHPTKDRFMGGSGSVGWGHWSFMEPGGSGEGPSVPGGAAASARGCGQGLPALTPSSAGFQPRDLRGAWVSSRTAPRRAGAPQPSPLRHGSYP